MIIGETVLYNKDASGSIREWAIGFWDDKIQIRYGLQNGAMQEQTESVEDGKAGRSRKEQVMSRIASRISSQRDKGYRLSVAEIGSKAVNTMGMEKPMLAQLLKNVKNIDFKHAFVQRKYDGNRCLIAKKDGKIFAYTRNGKPITTIGHIFEGLDLEEGMIVDGELYCHGQPLQTIVSWIKREQPETLQLQYHAYDLMSDDPFWLRYGILSESIVQDSPCVQLVPTHKVDSMDKVHNLFRTFRSEKYEGAILRWGDFGYEDGKRSKSLVKIKAWLDTECKVIDIHQSADGWGILECLFENGKTFRASAPGSMSEKLAVWAMREHYLGKYVTVQYAQLTKDGVPFHPIATGWDKHLF